MIQELLDLGLSESFIEEVLTSKKYKRINSEKYFPIDEQKEIALKLYEVYRIPNYKIAMLSGISEASSKKWLTSYGFKNRGHYTGKNSENNYFEEIDSFDKAYFLGFIFADGCVQDFSTDTNNRKSLSLVITEGDGYLLQKFLDYSKTQATIVTSHKEDSKPRKQIEIWSCKIYDDLFKLGVIPRKSKKETTLQIPNIREDLISHFIRGYFDGDGIGFSDGKLGFCGNLQILTYIKENISKFVQINGNPSITYNEVNHIYYLVYGKKDAQLIANFLYKDKNDLYLTRKYDIYNRSV